MENINLENASKDLKYVDEYGQPLLEMAITRSEAIDRCMNLGQRFIEHFKKIVEEDSEKDVLNHWCNEMQGWFDQVSKIKLKPKSNYLQFNNLMDWFFTVGSDPESYLGDNYDTCKSYNDFILKLYNCKNVKDALIQCNILKG